MTQSPTPPPPPSPPDVAGVRPHRGPLILVMGILGIVCSMCFVFGIIAWIFGKNDLAAMEQGQMDKSGEGLTKAGMICGMVGVGLGVLYWLLNIIWLIVGGGMLFMTQP